MIIGTDQTSVAVAPDAGIAIMTKYQRAGTGAGDKGQRQRLSLALAVTERSGHRLRTRIAGAKFLAKRPVAKI